MANLASFPRRNAVTRRFTLGAPRDVRVSRDGTRVLFVRSRGGADPVNCMWRVSVDPDAGTVAEERLVLDPAAVGIDEDDLPAEERARRERAREAGEGIVSYDADPDLTRACVALGGTVMVVDVEQGEWETFPSAPGAFDPRLAPDGESVAYVADDALHLVDAHGDRVVIDDPSPTVSWGAAEFVAGEEMGRTRGFWWAPDGQSLLVQRVDVAPIEQWWIAAPVTPDVAPTPVRYPAAGTANADVALAVVGLDGSRIDVDWCGDEWEYFANASWTNEALLLTVQTRDQRTVAIVEVDPATGQCQERHRFSDSEWVELIPGSPRLHDGRLVTVEDHGVARRLCVDGVALTPDELQVRRVVDATDAGVTVVASASALTADIVRVSWTGEIETLTDGAGMYGAVMGGATSVVVGRTMAAATIDVRAGGASLGPLIDHSERPDGELNVEFLTLGSRDLNAALVLPLDHVGSPLPVLMDPYGGPHAQRVQRSAGLFTASQWFAEQGFAVLIVDGRGTPGRGPQFERSVRGDLAAPVLDDQVDALRACSELRPELDLTRVAIRGWSFGGYLAALAVLRRPDVFHAAVAGAPVTDWRLYDTHYTERYLGHPGTEPDNYVRTDLRTDVAALGTDPLRPLMLIHGLADDNVVAAHTLQLSRALLEAGQPHTVLPLSGVTHMTPQEEVAENLLLVQLAFLREALGIAQGG